MDLNHIQSALEELDLDAWLLYDYRGLNPIAQRIAGMADHRLTRRWFCGIPRQGEPVWIAPRIEQSAFAGQPGLIQPYAGWRELQDLISRFLQEVAPPDRVPQVAMEYAAMGTLPDASRVDAGTYELLVGLGACVVSSADMLQACEARWSTHAADLHVDAAEKLLHIKDECWEKVARALRDGEMLTEWDLQQFVLERFQEEGLVTEHEPIAALGPNSARPHYSCRQETALPIRDGEVLLLDIWARFDDPEAVFADITWTAFTGNQAPEQVREIFDVVRWARDAAVEFVQDRITSLEPVHGYEVDDVARAIVTEAGYGEHFIHRTGHSLGRHVHGSGAHLDNLETHDERLLLTGTGFTIEPGIYLPDEFGIRSEINMYLSQAAPWVTTVPVQTEVAAVMR